MQDEGSLAFWLKHEHTDWTTNSHQYSFGTLVLRCTKVTSIKHPDCTLELDIDGPFAQSHNVRLGIPPCDERGLFLAITWQRPEIKIYFNGAISHTITV